MITADTYQKYLSSRGGNLGTQRKNKSDQIMNATFTDDVTYKKVYILTKNGWKYEDAKYQRHTTPSILKDAVDYYLQFRPKVHYPVGTYVFVPDDTSTELNLSGCELDDPFSLPDERITQLWFIVGRNNSNSFVRYNILQCNWNFKWIWNGELYKCWGAIRTANSYTSGRWDDEYGSFLDNLTAAWLPDTYYIYKDNLSNLGLYDNRTILYEQRFMLTNNKIEPKVYQTTKVTDTAPHGVIKLSLKQDEFNTVRDNVDLLVCDYYSSSGETHVGDVEDNYEQDNSIKISSMFINDADELEQSNDISTSLFVGETSYYNVTFSGIEFDIEWKLSVLNDIGLDEEETTYYEGLIKMDNYDKRTISLRPAKARSLIGKRFILSVITISGKYYSSIELEVFE